MNSIPLSEDNFNKEINCLNCLAKVNGYRENLLENLLHKHRLKELLTLAYAQTNSGTKTLKPKYFFLPYLGPISHNIAKILEKEFENIKISCKDSNSLNNVIVNNKDKDNTIKKSGVDSLSCSDCIAVYVGQTSRPLKTRINEHINRTEVSQFSEHIKLRNHHIIIEDCKIIHTKISVFLRLIQETVVRTSNRIFQNSLLPKFLISA